MEHLAGFEKVEDCFHSVIADDVPARTIEMKIKSIRPRSLVWIGAEEGMFHLRTEHRDSQKMGISAVQGKLQAESIILTEDKCATGEIRKVIDKGVNDGRRVVRRITISSLDRKDFVLMLT